MGLRFGNRSCVPLVASGKAERSIPHSAMKCIQCARPMVASLVEEHPTMCHQPYYGSSSGAARRRRRRLPPKGRKKGNHFFRKSQIYSPLFLLNSSLINNSELSYSSSHGHTNVCLPSAMILPSLKSTPFSCIHSSACSFCQWSRH